MFIQFREAFKQLARAAFVENVQLSHIFKRDMLMLRNYAMYIVSIVL